MTKEACYVLADGGIVHAFDELAPVTLCGQDCTDWIYLIAPEEDLDCPECKRIVEHGDE